MGTGESGINREEYLLRQQRKWEYYQKREEDLKREEDRKRDKDLKEGERGSKDGGGSK